MYNVDNYNVKVIIQQYNKMVYVGKGNGLYRKGVDRRDTIITIYIMCTLKRYTIS